MDDIQEYALNGFYADSDNSANGDDKNSRVRELVDNIHWIPAETTNTDHMVPRRYQTVTEADMMEENAISMRKVIYLRLLRIKAQHKKGDGYTTSTGKKASTKTELGSHRLFLCMDVMSKNGETVYLTFNTTSENKNMWSKAMELRDNGVFSIGTCFAVLAPRRVVQKYNNDVPLVYTDGGIVIMQNSIDLPKVLINNNIPEKVTRAFSTNATLTLQNVSVVDTKCSGFLCDRQRIYEIQRNQEGCGCFSASNRLSNMVICFDLLVKSNIDVYITQFCSNRFSNLFLTEPFPDAMTWRIVIYL